MASPGAGDLSIPLDRAGVRAGRRLSAALVTVGAACVVMLALDDGPTEIVGSEVPKPVLVVASLLVLAVGAAVWRWAGANRSGGLAVWSEGHDLFLHAHPGPAMRVAAADVVSVSPVAESDGTTEKWAYGRRFFVVRTSVPVSPGVTDVPVQERFVAGEIDAVRDEVAAWVERANWAP